MHGIKRTRISPQAAEAKRLKELSKIEAYTALQNDVLARKKAGEYTVEALGQTTELLDLNPEFYSIWNYRRHILLHGLFPGASPEDIVARLTSELRLTTAHLQIHPKVYWIWNHRKWCLENVPMGPGCISGSAEGGQQAGSSGTSDTGGTGVIGATSEESASASASDPKTGREGWRNQFWKMELGLIEKMLDADARNFHAWDYRRYVLRSLPSSFSPPHRPTDELGYTQKKIEANFSNFSAWHCRTKVLAGVWEGMGVEEVTRQKDKEFELVTQALWTDPGDQSGWLYHRWLIGSSSSPDSSPEEGVLRREIGSIRELHETEPDSKWCMNALAHYALLLARSPTTQADESAKLRAEAKELYSRLETVDSDRAQRYRDMAARC